MYSESAAEMSNWHIKVPKIVPEPLFPVRNMICNDKMIILIFLNVNKIDVVKAKINMYQGYDQCWLNLRSYTNIKLNEFFINFMITKGDIFILRKDIGVGGWSRNWQFSLTLCSENVLT